MNKTLLILIDGCRTDVLANVDTPAIESLMATGAWTLNARTVSPSITLPVHFSIFTSMPPSNHGIFANSSGLPPSESATGFFQWVKMMGGTTAMYYNWEFLRQLSPPGYLDSSIYLNTALTSDGDMRIAKAASDNIISLEPDFAFVYLGVLDETGHAHGYESQLYIDSLRSADQAVGYLLDELSDAGLINQYNILLQSDHGGFGHSHNDPVPEVMTIPWIMNGPDICSKEISETDITVLDTVPTLARCMGLPRHHLWQGKAIESIIRPTGI